MSPIFHQTSAQEFALSPRDVVFPVVRERPSDHTTPVAAALRLFEAGRPCFLLESAEGGERVGRFSFLGMNPTASIGGDDASLHELRAFFKAYAVAPSTKPPMMPAGAVGYLAYDAVRLWENLPSRHSAAGPAFLFHHFRDVVVFDHLKQRLFLVTLAPPSGARDADELAEHLLRLDNLEQRINEPYRGRGGVGVNLGDLTVTPDDATYRANVERAKGYILSGDVFQVVLARQFSRPFTGDPLQVYRALRMINPSPFMFYLDQGDHQIIGASPEDLVRVSGDHVETLPIAGTRSRGADDEEDAALAADLLADPKERAEHLMLVDLARNDIGRVAVPGTVNVDALMTIEKYSHVIHMVSRVGGQLAAGNDALDALFACFPAGTVSGAPKIRAMEIIDEMETVARGIYAGSVCYADGRGNLDSCIAIRTLVLRDGVASVSAGAGIVADSDPASEEIETRNKARAVLAALELAGTLGRI